MWRTKFRIGKMRNRETKSERFIYPYPTFCIQKPTGPGNWILFQHGDGQAAKLVCRWSRVDHMANPALYYNCGECPEMAGWGSGCYWVRQSHYASCESLSLTGRKQEKGEAGGGQHGSKHTAGANMAVLPVYLPHTDLSAGLPLPLSLLVSINALQEASAVTLLHPVVWVFGS